MAQQLGETTQQMMRDDDQQVQEILNRRPRGHYWIVIHHKQTKMRMDTGEHVLIKVIKDYDTKPVPKVGMIILEVKDGDIVDHVVSPHDAPIDWGTIQKHTGITESPVGIKGHPLVGSYVYNG